MDNDPDDLRRIQRLRAVLDPIPLHPRGTHVAEAGPSPDPSPDGGVSGGGSSGGGGGLSPQAVVHARLDQVAAQDEPEPIERAPWPEAMLCVWSTFNDARFATAPWWVGVVKRSR